MTMARGKFKRFLVAYIAVLSVFCSGQALASLQAHVDRNPVALNESFNLILQSDDGHSDDPDLSPLKSDFDILGQSKSSSVQISNGQATQSTQWQVSLIAKHGGQLHIPSISISGQSSPPIDVNVSDASQAQTSQDSGDLFVEVSAEPHAVHVQQQIIFTVRLYSAVGLGGGSSLSAPNFPNMDAVVEKLGNDRSFQTARNGLSYSVIERRFALFPQKSGEFNSDPIVFDGNVVDPNQHDGIFMFNPFSRPSHHLRVRSNTVAFSVKPIPAGYAVGQWLPASKLQLEEHWSSNPPTFTVGEPITRTVVETAGGLTSSQLPALDGGTLDGFKLYPDQPQLKDDNDDAGVTGRREQKIAYIPTRPGDVTLPAIEVKWWNTGLNKEEVASLPVRHFTVLPEKPGQASALPPASTQGLDAYMTAGSMDAASSAPTSRTTHFSAGWWPWLSLFLGVGWCVTLFLCWWRTRKQPGKTGDMVSKRAPQREISLKDVEKQLKKSCLENDPTKAKTLLLACAKHQWPADPPVSLIAIAHRSHPKLAEALTELDRVLYANTKADWRGETLWNLYAARIPETTRKETDKDQALESLYPRV
jgi:hypothetical protein